MRELAQLFTEADRLRAGAENQNGEAPAAVATIVEVNGSSYRLEGARMLIRPDGRYVGTLSGGCLEGEVVQHAAAVMDTGRPQLIALQQKEGEDPFGFGSGCGGTVHILLEPFYADADEGTGGLALLQHCFERRCSGALATVYRSAGTLCPEHGHHLLVTEAEPAGRGTIQEEALREVIAGDARTTLGERRPLRQTYDWADGRAEVLIEHVHPPVRLLIVGEEHDVGPLVEQATLLGWKSVVIGASPVPELRECVPGADAHIALPHPENAVDELPTLGPRDAAVTMSHNYMRDRAVLRHLLVSGAGYLGAVGASARLERLVADLAEETPALRKALADGRLSGPVGLDIGAETPEEIALSIAAEVQAVFAGREGGRLSRKDGRIHPPSARPADDVRQFDADASA